MLKRQFALSKTSLLCKTIPPDPAKVDLEAAKIAHAVKPFVHTVNAVNLI